MPCSRQASCEPSTIRLPGGPASALLGERATPEAIAQINEAYGFDRPLIEQYFTYIGRLLTGDFGNSVQTNRPVLDEFATRFPATVELAIVALVIYASFFTHHYVLDLR